MLALFAFFVLSICGNEEGLCSLGFEGSAVPGACFHQATDPISLLAAATGVLAEVALKIHKR